MYLRKVHLEISNVCFYIKINVSILTQLYFSVSIFSDTRTDVQKGDLMNNEEIRIAIFESRFSKSEIAEELGIKPNTFSHWLMEELDPMRKKLVMNAIERLKKEMG